MNDTVISTAITLIFLVLYLVLLRRASPDKTKVGGFLHHGVASFITATTPTWLALAVLILAWLGNAAGSAVLWALSIGNKEFGHAIALVNFASILWSLNLFVTNRRVQAIRNLQWVIPCAVCVAVAYAYARSLVA